MRNSRCLVVTSAFLLFLIGCGGGGSAPAPAPGPGDGFPMTAPMELDGIDAYKTKLLRVTWNDAGTFKTILVSIYGNGVGDPVWDHGGNVHAARDIFVTRSVDGGGSWSAPLNVSNTAQSSSIDADHDGDVATPPIPYVGDSGKPTVFSQGKNISIIWEDALVDESYPGPTPAQGTVIYPESDLIEVPYRAIYVARSKDAGQNWVVERLTDASRDAKQSVCRGSSAGWAYSWQEDPEGLQPGDAEGPGEGGSGAKVSKETDIWYVAQSGPDFGAQMPLGAPVRVTNNLGSNTGSSRANLVVFGNATLIAYEETKGTEGLEEGKYVRYHLFSDFLDPLGSDASSGAGWILSTPLENARRVRILIGPGGATGPVLGTKVCFIWKQGLYDQGGPSDIMMRIGYSDASHGGPADGAYPDQLWPAVNAMATLPAGAAASAPPLNLSSSAGLGSGTDDNAYEDARAHRGIIRGDSILLGYTYTPDWAVARYTDLENYNFFIRRSTDGGGSWSDPRNVSLISDKTISVREPRIVGTPNSADPDDPQDPNCAYLAWGTEVNQYEHQSEGIIDLDMYIIRTLDFGQTFSPLAPLAEGLNGQFESQLRCSPDGLTMWAVWNESDDTVGITTAMFRRTIP